MGTSNVTVHNFFSSQQWQISKIKIVNPAEGFPRILSWAYSDLLPIVICERVFPARLIRSQRKIIEVMITPVNTERNITIAKDA